MLITGRARKHAVALVASELITNVILHGLPPLTLHLGVSDEAEVIPRTLAPRTA